jgi:thiamine pyrophosphate-dependent acetolactate synthase large subunit-like protein
MNTESELSSLKRRDVAKLLLADRKNLIVVGGLGSCAWDITNAGDHNLNFPLWGAMGGAASVGLGLALSKPNYRVLVITGDGEMLMGLGSLATIAQKEPKNLAVVIFDNERYGETGMQKTHTAFGADLPAVAAAVGFHSVETVINNKELDRFLPEILGGLGPIFCSIKVRAESLDFVLPPNNGVILKNRMRKALL